MTGWGGEELWIERRKAKRAAGRAVNAYFWRTYDLKEIDCIEEYGGKLHGFEFKWQGGSIRPATRSEFLLAYPGSELGTVTQQNFEDFLKWPGGRPPPSRPSRPGAGVVTIEKAEESC